MNPFVQQMINYKINHMTPEQLYKLAVEYNVSLSKSQAKKVIEIIREEPVNIVDATQRKRILKKIGREVDPILARRIKVLLDTFL